MQTVAPKPTNQPKPQPASLTDDEKLLVAKLLVDGVRRRGYAVFVGLSGRVAIVFEDRENEHWET